MLIGLLLNAGVFILGLGWFVLLPKAQRVLFAATAVLPCALSAALVVYHEAWELLQPANVGLWLLRGGFILSIGVAVAAVYWDCKYTWRQRVQHFLQRRKK